MEIFLKKGERQMKYYKISSDRLLVVLDSVKRTISTSKTMDDCTFSRLYNDVNWLFEIGYIDASRFALFTSRFLLFIYVI